MDQLSDHYEQIWCFLYVDRSVTKDRTSFTKSKTTQMQLLVQKTVVESNKLNFPFEKGT